MDGYRRTLTRDLRIPKKKKRLRSCLQAENYEKQAKKISLK